VWNILKQKKTLSSRKILRPTIPPIQIGAGGGVFFLRDKWKECDVNHSSPCGVEVKNEWRYTSTPMCLDGVDRETFTFTF